MATTTPATPPQQEQPQDPQPDLSTPGNIREVVDAVLKEDEEKARSRQAAAHSSTAGGRKSSEKSRSRSQSRSRPTSLAGDPVDTAARRRSSVWNQDKEKKNRNVVRRIFDHHWVPGFLK